MIRRLAVAAAMAVLVGAARRHTLSTASLLELAHAGPLPPKGRSGFRTLAANNKNKPKAKDKEAPKGEAPGAANGRDPGGSDKKNGGKPVAVAKPGQMKLEAKAEAKQEKEHKLTKLVTADRDVIDLGKHGSLRRAQSYKHGRKAYQVYEQDFEGVRVLGPRVAVVTGDESGALPHVRGHVMLDIAADVSSSVPAVSEAQALQVAKRVSSGGSVQDSTVELLVWVSPDDRAHLVYHVVTLSASASTASNPHVFVDASKGVVLRAWDGLRRAYVSASGIGGNPRRRFDYSGGTGPGIFGPLTVSQNAGTCTLETKNVRTMDYRTSGYVATPRQFPCSSGTPQSAETAVNGGYSPLNDAHYFANTAFQMWQAWFGEQVLERQLQVFVHYLTEYSNLFYYNWGGTQPQVYVGDASGQGPYHPLASLDLICHEIAHGYTGRFSKLLYTEQSGAIDEAFSDMAGQACRKYLLGTADWKMAADVIKLTAPFTAQRFINTPAADGYSADGCTVPWKAGLDPHYGSGVFNKAFYTLATSSGWDVQSAFDVFRVANRVYWGASANFSIGACGVQLAASDMGRSIAAVARAFAAACVACPTLADPKMGLAVTATGVVAVSATGTSLFWLTQVSGPNWDVTTVPLPSPLLPGTLRPSTSANQTIYALGQEGQLILTWPGTSALQVYSVQLSPPGAVLVVEAAEVWTVAQGGRVVYHCEDPPSETGFAWGVLTEDMAVIPETCSSAAPYDPQEKGLYCVTVSRTLVHLFRTNTTVMIQAHPASGMLPFAPVVRSDGIWALGEAQEVLWLSGTSVLGSALHPITLVPPLLPGPPSAPHRVFALTQDGQLVYTAVSDGKPVLKTVPLPTDVPNADAAQLLATSKDILLVSAGQVLRISEAASGWATSSIIAGGLATAILPKTAVQGSEYSPQLLLCAVTPEGVLVAVERSDQVDVMYEIALSL